MPTRSRIEFATSPHVSGRSSQRTPQTRRMRMLRNIADSRIGHDEPLFVIAEIGLNHGGSVERALALVDEAASAGASAIKLQTLTADRLVSDTAHGAPAPQHLGGRKCSLVEFFRRFELDEAAHRAIVERARSLGLAVLATPF